jgi:L-fuculose-phosphate aldolase
MLESERRQVAAAARRLASERLVLGTAGNVSTRSGDLVAITPTGAVLGEVEPADVVVVGLGGEPVEGELAPTSELALHLGAYRRYGAGAVVHTHSPAATAVSCVLDELPVVHYQMIALGGSVRVAPYATFGTEELAELTLDALDGRQAALMSNHGAVTVGDTVTAAVENSLLLEWVAEVYWRAASLGTPRVLDDQQIEDYRATVAARGYRPLQRADR